MIYTCTLNPAIDLFVALEDLKPNIVNRTNDEDYQANGKGINISFVLNMLGIQSTALGFIAGFTGHYIQDELRKKGGSDRFY
nr:PfkB family carbohydrate kinase [Paenibacillus larvae]